MSLINILSEGADEAYSAINKRKQLQKFLDKNGYTYKYYREGTQGYVYELTDKDKIIKLTFGEYKEKLNKKLEGKKLKNVVNIHLVKGFWDEDKSYDEPLLVVMERLEPVPKNEQSNVIDAINAIGYHMSRYPEKLKNGDVYNKLKNKNAPKKSLEIFKQLNNGFQELLSLGIEYNDFGIANTAYDPKTNQYKFIDIDSSEIL